MRRIDIEQFKQTLLNREGEAASMSRITHEVHHNIVLEYLSNPTEGMFQLLTLSKRACDIARHNSMSAQRSARREGHL